MILTNSLNHPAVTVKHFARFNTDPVAGDGRSRVWGAAPILQGGAGRAGTRERRWVCGKRSRAAAVRAAPASEEVR